MPVDIGAQGQLIGQFNVNAQLGFAESDVSSGAVDVSSFEEDPSDGNGIIASSSAFSKAELEQKAEQENENEANIEFPFDATPAAAVGAQEIVYTGVSLGFSLRGCCRRI